MTHAPARPQPSDSLAAAADAPQPQTTARTRWKPGQSGNPQGRPKGQRNYASRITETLLCGETEALVRKLLDLALGGDVAALRLCLDRLLPPMRSRPMDLTLPEGRTPADVNAGLQAVIAAAARGDIEIEQAHIMAEILELKRRSIETIEIEDRLARLERRRLREQGKLPPEPTPFDWDANDRETELAKQRWLEQYPGSLKPRPPRPGAPEQQGPDTTGPQTAGGAS